MKPKLKYFYSVLFCRPKENRTHRVNFTRNRNTIPNILLFLCTNMNISPFKKLLILYNKANVNRFVFMYK